MGLKPLEGSQNPCDHVDVNFLSFDTFGQKEGHLTCKIPNVLMLMVVVMIYLELCT